MAKIEWKKLAIVGVTTIVSLAVVAPYLAISILATPLGLPMLTAANVIGVGIGVTVGEMINAKL